jgi:hypothetical protein
MENNITEADVRQALIDAEGNLSWAAARCKLTRTQLCAFIDAMPSLQALLVELDQKCHDDAESALKAAAAAGKKWAVKFLKRRGLDKSVAQRGPE